MASAGSKTQLPVTGPSRNPTSRRNARVPTCRRRGELTSSRAMSLTSPGCRCGEPCRGDPAGPSGRGASWTTWPGGGGPRQGSEHRTTSPYGPPDGHLAHQRGNTASRQSWFRAVDPTRTTESHDGWCPVSCRGNHRLVPRRSPGRPVVGGPTRIDPLWITCLRASRCTASPPAGSRRGHRPRGHLRRYRVAGPPRY